VVDISDGYYQFDNPHIYELPKHSVDISLSQVIFHNIDIKLGVRNLLNEKTIWQQGRNFTSATLYGRRFTLNFGYSFN